MVKKLGYGGPTGDNCGEGTGGQQIQTCARWLEVLRGIRRVLSTYGRREQETRRDLALSPNWENPSCVIAPAFRLSDSRLLREITQCFATLGKRERSDFSGHLV
jgi:hypothetical protein